MPQRRDRTNHAARKNASNLVYFPIVI